MKTSMKQPKDFLHSFHTDNIQGAVAIGAVVVQAAKALGCCSDDQSSSPSTV